MPMQYFKCECGAEKRNIVKHDRTGYRQLKNGNWRFDPDAPKVDKVPETMTCECGKTVTESQDPKAVNSFIQFNFMES